jgi:hypothetical protein
MRCHLGLLLAMAGLCCSGTATRGDDQNDPVKKQKETASANWKQLYGEENAATEETGHLLIYGPGTMTARHLKDLGIALETRYDLARRVLKMEPKEELWPGKLAVYLLEDRKSFNTFMRTIARRRPDNDESGVFSLRDGLPFVAACHPQNKYDSGQEAQAGDQLAGAILTKKGGDSLPEWLLAGFGRATAWRAAPTVYYNQRTQARKLIKGHSAEDVWNGKLNAEEAAILRASLVDFLAFGPGAASFPQFVDGFKPAQNNQSKTTPDALKAARLEPDRLNRAWSAWVAKSR